MSWLARSLVNSLRDEPSPPAAGGDGDEDDSDSDSQPSTPSRGVKEDLSELTQTLTRQFWGVASFLAPPPSASSAPDSASDSDELPTLAGIRSDLAEIGGKVRSGISSISALSSNKAVTEISKIASTLFGSDGEEEEDEEGVEMRGVSGVGVSEEVVAFVRSVSLHPETWLDFPMLADGDDADDFNMSDAQEEHAFAMEELAPSLAALRVQLCPGHMSAGCFWKIYFVLVHPKLNKHDAGLLSTPQIVQARAMLLPDMPIRRGPESVHSGVEAVETSHEELATLVAAGEKVGSPAKGQMPENFPTSTSVSSTEFETDKHTVQTTELQIIEKSVVEEESVQGKSKDIPTDTTDIPALGYEEGDDWLEDESGEPSAPRGTTVHLGNDEDVSFSDLEADDDDDDGGEGMHFNSKTKTPTVGSPKEESGWVQLDKSSEGAVRSGNSSSPEWLDVDMDTV